MGAGVKIATLTESRRNILNCVILTITFGCGYVSAQSQAYHYDELNGFVGGGETMGGWVHPSTNALSEATLMASEDLAGGSPNAFASSDLNNDGIPDVVAMISGFRCGSPGGRGCDDREYDKIHVWLSANFTGEDMFTNSSTIACSDTSFAADQLSMIELVDVDKDGDVDIAINSMQQ